MKHSFLPLAFPFLLAGIFISGTRHTAIDLNKNNAIIGCGPDSPENLFISENGKFIVPMPGWGNYSYTISTRNDSTQFYFNQGLNMYYSYHMREALASFKEASRLDPSCAMAYWGQALAMGPNYNFAHTYTMSNAVLPLLQQMNNAAGSASPKEKDLISVMNLRYSTDTLLKRPSLNQAYADGLKKLIRQYPGDNDIKTFYVDAVMLIQPWNFWNNDGTAKQWTPELVDLCEAVLKVNPEHPAALHYHIHLTEASRHPQVALENADALQRLLPGVAHMVHMASHEYERMGLYAKGVEANDLADEDLGRYEALAKNISLSAHVPHYLAVQSYCALSGAMYKTGMINAQRCKKSVAPTHEETYEQYLYMMPELTLVRLGKWAEILAGSDKPGSQWTYALALYHFARGMAFAKTGHADSAMNHLAQLRENAKDPILAKRNIPFNAPLSSIRIADGILDATISFSLKNYDAMIISLRNAIKTEDELIYREPKDWMMPARQYLGAYLLKMGNPSLAEKTYREDLIWNPGSAWSLLGLCQSMRAQNKKKNLKKYEVEYRRSFSRAEEMPLASAY